MTNDILVVGGGPAGLACALAAAQAGAKVTLADRNHELGGQLVKQTHKFFGSAGQFAGTRGFEIAQILTDKVKGLDAIRVLNDTEILAYYPDGVLTAERNSQFLKLKPRVTVIATGAQERHLAFPNNDLPGIYGAGAVQTLMNLYAVKPGNKVVMVGAGNIGLIISYQLLQADVAVKAVVEAAPKIGGYLVHAAKIRRAGVPILTSHTVTRAIGREELEAVEIAKVDAKWKPIAGTEQVIEADVLCLAVGLSPLTELLWQSGCRMKYVPELGGHVPVRDRYLRTSIPSVYVAGDASGVEEASSALVEGELAGLSAAHDIGCTPANYEKRINEALLELANLRGGPVGEKIRAGLARIGIDLPA